MSQDPQVIKNRWRLSRKIGAGAFGEIFSAVDLVTSEQVAVKLEKCDSKKQVLKLEVAVLKKLQGCSHVAKFIYCGRANDYNYCVMELLGENLSDLRRRRPQQKFTMATCVRLGSQMLRAIQNCHRRGFLHRDIKPSNYAIGLTPEKARTVYIIDFGLARRYRLPTGEHRPPRDSAGFRGTARYASIQSHQAQELARRDDLWSLFYVMVEFMVGQLPWRRLKEKDDILKLKLKHTNADLLRGLPPEMNLFLTYLNTLQYETDPDYDYIDSLFKEILKRTGLDESAPYDWQIHTGDTPPTTPVPSGSYDVQVAASRAAEILSQQRRSSNMLVPRPPSELPANSRPSGRYGSSGVPVPVTPPGILPQQQRTRSISDISPARVEIDEQQPKVYLTPTASRDHSHSDKLTGPRRASAISLNAGEVTTAEIVDQDDLSQGSPAGTPVPISSSRRGTTTPTHVYLTTPVRTPSGGRIIGQRIHKQASDDDMPTPRSLQGLDEPVKQQPGVNEQQQQSQQAIAAPAAGKEDKSGAGCCQCALM